jgi:hypothetical protein
MGATSYCFYSNCAVFMSEGQIALQRVHGGLDRHGVPLYDFSSAGCTQNCLANQTQIHTIMVIWM